MSHYTEHEIKKQGVSGAGSLAGPEGGLPPGRK
jgi:hypothetical protein